MSTNKHIIKAVYNYGFSLEAKAIGGKFNCEADQWEFPIEKANEADKLKDVYFGASKKMTPFQKRAAKAVKARMFETTKNQELIIKKDDEGLFMLDAVGYSGNVTEIKKDLKPCGLTISKVVGKRMYISKI